jgi:hypothetical protein
MHLPSELRDAGGEGNLRLRRPDTGQLGKFNFRISAA